MYDAQHSKGGDFEGYLLQFYVLQCIKAYRTFCSNRPCSLPASIIANRVPDWKRFAPFSWKTMLRRWLLDLNDKTPLIFSKALTKRKPGPFQRCIRSDAHLQPLINKPFDTSTQSFLKSEKQKWKKRNPGEEERKEKKPNLKEASQSKRAQEMP